MAGALIEELPCEILIRIFDIVIYSCYDVDYYIALRAKEIDRCDAFTSRGRQVPSRRLTLRLVCQYFRHLIDSARFWSGKTIVVSKKHLEWKTWAFYDKIGVTSLVLSPSVPPSCSRRPHLYHKLSSLGNLRHFSYSCNLDEHSFEMINCLSAVPLQTVEIVDAMHWHIDCGHVRQNLESLLTVLSKFSKSLRKLTICADVHSSNFNSYHQCYMKNIDRIEMVDNKHSLVSKLKETLPMVQTITLRHFYDGNTFCMRTEPFLEQSLHFLKEVNSILMVEKLPKTFPAFNCEGYRHFPNFMDERFEENEGGTMDMKSLTLVVTEETFKDIVFFKEMVKVKQVVVLRSSTKMIDFTTALIHWNMLETIVLGGLYNARARRSYSLFVPFPVLPDIINTLQCFNNLTKVHFYMQAMLRNEDIDTISRSNGISLQELCFDVCPNIDDICLYSIKTRFQYLLYLTVLDCHSITGSFLQQNYYGFEMVPKLKRIKVRLMFDFDLMLIINAIELIRIHSNYRVEMIFL